MSTRSVIARKQGSGFSGVYHHWDGYPSGLGQTLFELRNGHFKRNTSAMLAFLIDQHPAGWSTINGADFTLLPGFGEEKDAPCVKCACPEWMHYRQYYKSHKLPEPPGYVEGSYAVFNHGYIAPERPKGPQCYCHGGRKEKGQRITERNAAGCGCEWAYVFDGDTMLIQSSFRQNGEKMIGMFGMGDPLSEWRTVASVELDGDGPDWKALDECAESITA